MVKFKMNKKAGVKQIILNLFFVGIFMIAMIAFGVNLAKDNSSNQSIVDYKPINSTYNDLNSALGEYSADANGANAALVNSTPTTTAGVLGTTLEASATIWNTITLIPKTIYTLTLGLVFDSIFGAGSGYAIFATLLTGIMIVVVILYAIYWMRLGNPDS